MMNIKNIKALAEILNQGGLTALEISEGETTIRLEKAPAPAPAAPISAASAAPSVSAVSTVSAGADAAQSEHLPANFNNIVEVKSPMVGVFYIAPAPDAEPYVRVGSKVRKGDVLCIIEAMKLMNEIVAETDGEIADICVSGGDIVEYSQVLFKIFK